MMLGDEIQNYNCKVCEAMSFPMVLSSRFATDARYILVQKMWGKMTQKGSVEKKQRDTVIPLA